MKKKTLQSGFKRIQYERIWNEFMNGLYLCNRNYKRWEEGECAFHC